MFSFISDSFQAQITNAMVASIYQQELAKMAGQGVPPHHPGILPPVAHTPTPHGVDSTHSSSTSNRSSHPKRSESTDSNSSSRGRRAQADDRNLSEEMVSRIYQEELKKLASQAQKSGNIAECNMYQQELQRIAMESQRKAQVSQASSSPYGKMNGHITTMARPDEDDDDQPKDLSTKVKSEPRTPDRSDQPQAEDLSTSNKENIAHSRSSSGEQRPPSVDDSQQEALRHAGSAFFLVRPRSNPQMQYDPALIAAAQAQYANAVAGMQGAAGDPMSPLQRMQVRQARFISIILCSVITCKCHFWKCSQTRSLECA